MVLSSDEVDRKWSREELEELSAGELTWLTFRRHYRNAAFFGPLAIAAYYVSQLLGRAGAIVGWIALLLVASFAAYNAVGVLVLIFVFARQPSFSKLVQSAIVAMSCAFYAALAIVLWSALR